MIYKLNFKLTRGNELVLSSPVLEVSSHKVNIVSAHVDMDDYWRSFQRTCLSWQIGGTVKFTDLDAQGNCIVPHELMEVTGRIRAAASGVNTDNKNVITERDTTHSVECIDVTEQVPL